MAVGFRPDRRYVHIACGAFAVFDWAECYELQCSPRGGCFGDCAYSAAVYLPAKIFHPGRCNDRN